MACLSRGCNIESLGATWRAYQGDVTLSHWGPHGVPIKGM